MKVFQVITETYNDNEIKDGIKKPITATEAVRYVTADSDSIKLVTDYFARQCEQCNESLISVREAVTIIQHIKKEL